MKEVIKCSLSGVAFTMDTEAYQTLKEYLEALKNSYKDSADGEEIIADIEARIAELILSAQDPMQVVEKPLILRIIAQMGAPEDISDPAADGSPAGETRFPRRLYRDTDHARLGGVCAGIGRYFDIDPTWVRLGLFAPLLLMALRWIPFLHWTASIMGNLFGIFVLCYLIMWFAVPAARTARQRLEMTGERITARSICKTTSAAGTCDPDHRARSIVAEVVSVFGKVVLLILQILLSCMVFALIIGACCLIICMFALFISGPEVFHILLPSLWTPVLGIFFVLIPIILLIYVFMSLIASRKPGGKVVLILFLLWIVAIIAFASVAIREHFGEQVLHRSGILKHIANTQVVIDGDTTSVRRLLQDEQIEAVFDKSARTLRISVPDQQINISIDPNETPDEASDKTD